jgi:hypothetical protein
MQTQQPQIVIDFLPDGTMKREVLNVQGESCTELTKPLDGIGNTEVTPKPEFYELPVVHTETVGVF